MKTLDTLTLGFIGGGNMAEAIVKGLLDQNIISADRIVVSDPSAARLEVFSHYFKTRTSADNARVIGSADIVILAVKPQMIASVLEPVTREFRKDQIVISIAAGIRSNKINALCSDIPVVIRVMPNTPALVGKGITALCRGARADEEHLGLASALFNAVGKSFVVDENSMDAVTAISGSGPAYMFYWLEAMLAAAKDAGFSPEQSRNLVYGTFEGAIALAENSDDSPEVLRQRVTSKGGTTEAAVKVMADHNVATIIGDAVKAAIERSRELSEA